MPSISLTVSNYSPSIWCLPYPTKTPRVFLACARESKERPVGFLGWSTLLFSGLILDIFSAGCILLGVRKRQFCAILQSSLILARYGRESAADCIENRDAAKFVFSSKGVKRLLSSHPIWTSFKGKTFDFFFIYGEKNPFPCPKLPMKKSESYPLINVEHREFLRRHGVLGCCDSRMVILWISISA